VAEAANRASHAWHARGVLPDSLDECRAALFFERRRWRHLDQGIRQVSPLIEIRVLRSGAKGEVR
jgi:hypothetical protein